MIERRAKITVEIHSGLQDTEVAAGWDRRTVATSCILRRESTPRANAADHGTWTTILKYPIRCILIYQTLRKRVGRVILLRISKSLMLESDKEDLLIFETVARLYTVPMQDIHNSALIRNPAKRTGRLFQAEIISKAAAKCTERFSQSWQACSGLLCCPVLEEASKSECKFRKELSK